MSRLAQHIPFIFNILKKPDPPLQTAQESEIDESPETSDIAEFVSMDNAPEDMSVYSGELQALFRTNGEETSFMRSSSTLLEQSKFIFAEIILGQLIVLALRKFLLLCRDYSNVSDERKIELSNSDVATEGTLLFLF